MGRAVIHYACNVTIRYIFCGCTLDGKRRFIVFIVHTAIARAVLNRNVIAHIAGNLLLPQPQVFKERIAVRFPTQELFEDLHLIPAPSSLQNSVSVPTTRSTVHRRLFERGIKHIGTENLRPEVAIVT